MAAYIGAAPNVAAAKKPVARPNMASPDAAGPFVPSQNLGREPGQAVQGPMAPALNMAPAPAPMPHIGAAPRPAMAPSLRGLQSLRPAPMPNMGLEAPGIGDELGLEAPPLAGRTLNRPALKAPSMRGLEQPFNLKY